MSFKDLVSPSEREGKEKHVPVIDAQDSVVKDEWFEVSVVEKSGFHHALSSCNIHGVWESENKVGVK